MVLAIVVTVWATLKISIDDDDDDFMIREQLAVASETALL